MHTEIILSGFGGQGILFAGKCIAGSGMAAGKEISWLPSYGPEMRGGTANCSVCISDKKIGSPFVTSPDILIVMNTPSFDRFCGRTRRGGAVFADSSITDRTPDRDDIDFYSVPASETAEKNGLRGMGNTFLLGYMLSKCGERLCGITKDNAAAAFRQLIPENKPQLAEMNILALELGYAFRG